MEECYFYYSCSLQSATLLKVTGCFPRFLHFTNGTKSREASHMLYFMTFDIPASIKFYQDDTPLHESHNTLDLQLYIVLVYQYNTVVQLFYNAYVETFLCPNSICSLFLNIPKVLKYMEKEFCK